MHRAIEAARDVEGRLVEEERVEAGRLEEGLAGVALDAVLALDGDAPWRVRGWPVQLLVEEVAPAGDAWAKSVPGMTASSARHTGMRGAECRWRCPVRHRRSRRTGEPAVGRQHDGRQVATVDVELVDDVVKPGTDDGQDGAQEQDAGRMARIDALAAPPRWVTRTSTETATT